MGQHLSLSDAGLAVLTRVRRLGGGAVLIFPSPLKGAGEPTTAPNSGDACRLRCRSEDRRSLTGSPCRVDQR